MTNYQLTDEEIMAAAGMKEHKPQMIWNVADAASKKARNETNKEWRDWLKACKCSIGKWPDWSGDVLYDARGNANLPLEADPNRFCPKEAD